MRRSLPMPSSAARLLPVVASAALLAGCQLTSPVQTDVPYQPADGVAVDMGAVQIRDLVVVAEQEGGPGTIVGSLSNDADQAAQVQIAGEGGQPVTIEAPAHSHVSLSTTTKVTLPAVASAPGGVVTLQVGTSESGANVVTVPVLPATEYYEPFKPEASPTTAAAG